MRIDAVNGRVTVRSQDDHGQSTFESGQLSLPADLANGMILTVLKNAGLTRRREIRTAALQRRATLANRTYQSGLAEAVKQIARRSIR
jgi:hypothetical protein